MEVTNDANLKRKIRKNLLIVFIISSVMFFGGFISAYIVSKGDVFWMKVKVPYLFYINTVILILVSVLIHLALKKIKSGNKKATKILLGLSLLFGLSFFVLQIKAWNIMLDRGVAPINRNVVVFKGKYGEYFSIAHNSEILTLDGNQYFLKGELMSVEQRSNLSKFASQFLGQKNNNISLDSYAEPYTLLYKGKPVSYLSNKLSSENGPLSDLAFERLQDLMQNIVKGRGDFFAQGKYGEDFTLYYKGEKVDYKNREFIYKGKPLSTPMKLAMDDTDDKATAYFYLITFAHWIHIFAGVIVLISLYIRALRGKYNQVEYAGIETGALFWHFLDVLWLFLFLFLLFIH